MEICVGYIRAQMSFAEDPACRARMQTVYAYGYVFGLADRMFSKWGVQDEGEMVGCVGAVFVTLYGREEGMRLTEACLNEQRKEEFMRGRRTGGQEAVEYYNSRGEQVPLGLTDYLLGGAK